MATQANSSLHLSNELGSYMLCNDFAARSRLNLQFYIWKESLGFNLHPSIPLPSSFSSTSSSSSPATTSTTSPTANPTLKILDLATGTAIWLLDLSKELKELAALPSTVCLEGLDIDPSQAPPAEWLPPNMRVREWNIFSSPIPADLEGSCDVVHLRLLILVVKNGDPLPILERVWRLLKPGGYVQWDDLEYSGMRLVKTSTVVAAEAKEEAGAGGAKAWEQLQSIVSAGGRHDWVERLPEIMEGRAGFVDAKAYRFEDALPYVKARSDQHLMTLREFAVRLVAEGKREEGERLMKVIGEASRESEAGVAYSCPRLVCVARKPLP